MQPPVTILIYTYNSDRHIEACIMSAKLLTDSIIVVDQNSTDKTRTIAERMNAQVVTVPHHIYVEPVRMLGINQVKKGWLFILDADERITKELAAEISDRVVQDDSVTHFGVPRKNMFAKKKWLKYGGWYPDHQTRLIKRSAISDWPKAIHSTPVISGARKLLSNPMLHYFHGDIESMVNKTIIYEAIESEMLYKAKRQSSTRIFFRKFLGELNRRLIRQSGWKDGILGIIESVYQAYSKTVTYLFLYEKQHA